MITRLEIGNIGSIEHADITFEKGKYKYLEKFVMNDEIANPIAFYGRNGSGKSSILLAFGQLSTLLWRNPDNLDSFVPNLSKNVDIEKTESYIKLFFIIDNIKYEYYICTTLEKIVKEYLKVNNETIIERNNNTYSALNNKYTIDSKYFPALRDFYTKTNVDQRINNAYEYLSNIAFIGADKKNYCVKSFNNVKYLDYMANKSHEVKEILKKYKSFPIYDVNYFVDKKTGVKNYTICIEKENGKFNVPLSMASTGMMNQSFLLSVVLSLPKNGVLVIDELEDALHPLTIMNFINVVVEKNIQLIFSSHNTNTLSQLRPDNIIFANWKNGVSNYKRLSDIYPNIREVNNIEKMYLSSSFDEEIEK